jgi:hypothetical protein
MNDYNYGYPVGPFYRKFLAGDNVWVEINKDGTGGLFLHLGNSFVVHLGTESKPFTSVQRNNSWSFAPN